MPIQIQISDSDLTGYSQQAKVEFENATESYIRALLKEIKNVEEIRHRTSGGVPDVSIGMVTDACITLRSRFGGESPGWGRKAIRFFASALPFVVGLMWDAPWAVNPSGKLLYFLAAVVAIIFAVLSVSKE